MVPRSVDAGDESRSLLISEVVEILFFFLGRNGEQVSQVVEHGFWTVLESCPEGFNIFLPMLETQLGPSLAVALHLWPNGADEVVEHLLGVSRRKGVVEVV